MYVTESLNVEIEVLEYFNSFLKLRSKQLLGKKAIPLVKIKKIQFVNDMVVMNKLFFIKGNVQLCTPSIGKKYGVKAQTVMNWIKSLTQLGLIACTDKFWKQGFKAKTYKVVSESLLELMNKLNGYHKKYSTQINKMKAKKERRKRRMSVVNSLTVEYKDFCSISQAFLGCPVQYIQAIKSKFPSVVIESPSEHKPTQTKAVDVFNAYNYVNKKNGFPQMTFEHEAMLYDYYGEEVIVDNNFKQRMGKYARALMETASMSASGSHVKKRCIKLTKYIIAMAKGVNFNGYETIKDSERADQIS